MPNFGNSLEQVTDITENSSLDATPGLFHLPSVVLSQEEFADRLANPELAVETFSRDVLPKYREIIRGVHIAKNYLEYNYNGCVDNYEMDPRYDMAYRECVEPFFVQLEEYLANHSTEVRSTYIKQLVEPLSALVAEDFDYMPIVKRACQFIVEDGVVGDLTCVEDLVGGFINAHGKPFYEEMPEHYRGNIVWGTSDIENQYSSIFRTLAYCVSEKYKANDDAKEVAKFLAGLINEAGGMGDVFLRSFEKLGAVVGYKPLLDNLRSSDLLTRRMSAEILYRLEMGKIGVTDKEGVRYFDKIYQLAVANDPDFFVRLYRQGNAYVRRIDSSGSIGVFDGQERMLGRFQLQLEAEETQVIAPVYEITSRDVFLPKADETPEQRQIRENMLGLYLAGYGNLYDQIEQQTGVRLSSLDLHEQGWFITYFVTAAPGQQQELTQFVRTYGELGLKAFLALDYGESGEAILKYVEQSQDAENQQRALFLQFHKISTRAREWRRVFEQAETKSPYKFSAQLHEALIRKASEYFRAALMIEQGNGGEVTRQELMQSMGQISFALDALRGPYEEGSPLVLERTQVVSETIEKDGASAADMTTWTLRDEKAKTRVVVSVRPVATQRGQARINFGVVNEDRGVEARIAVDVDNWGLRSGDNAHPYQVSLDFGTGRIDRENRVYPSQRVGDLLNMVEGSEGGHNKASFGIEAVENFKSVATAFTNYMSGRYKPIKPSS